MAGYEGFEPVAPSAPATAPSPAYAGFERVEPGPAPGLVESLARGAAEGATLGFGDEIGLLSRERQEASRRANPWTHFIGEMLGTVAPAVAAAPVAAGRLGTSLVARGAQAAARPFAAADMSTLPRSIGQGAKLGASYGAVSGAGHADPSADASPGQALLQRAGGALGGGFVGGVLGGPAGAITYPIARAAQALGGARAAARAETENAGAGALTAMSRSLERDRITPQNLIDAIVADMPRGKKLTQTQMEEAFQLAQSGESYTSIASRFGVRPETISRRVRAAEENLAVPLTLTDRAKLVRPGAGENTGWTLRAASATPGEARAVARERLVERQLSQGERLSDAITKHIGTPDFEGRSAQLAQDVAAVNKQLYQAAHDTDALTTTLSRRTIGDAIDPMLTAHSLKWRFSRGPVADAIEDAVKALRPVELSPNGPIDMPIATLQQFMQAKQNLQSVFDKYATNKTALRELMAFKRDLYAAMRKHNPEWWAANEAAADGFAAERALNLGMEYAGRLGPQTREQMVKFRAMSDPEKELYRIGVAQKLNDRLLNREETHNLTSQMRLPASRIILREVLGAKQANRLFARLDREFATTRTYREQFGSQTTPLREAIDELSWAPQFQSVWDLMSPSKIAEQAAVWAARNMNERRNTQLLNMLTETNPVQQLNLLRALGPLHQARSRAGRIVGTPTVGALGAGVPNALAGALADLQRNQPGARR